MRERAKETELRASYKRGDERDFSSISLMNLPILSLSVDKSLQTHSPLGKRLSRIAVE